MAFIGECYTFLSRNSKRVQKELLLGLETEVICERRPKDVKMNTKSADMSGFSAASDMEFLNFEANEDSFDLSVSASGDFQNDNSGLLSSKASQASRDSSDWSPSAYSDSNSNTDFDDSSDILADIHLPSLGETGTARKILSQLMNESSPQRLKHLPKHYVTHAAEGYVALQHMNDDIRETREQSAALVEELTQLKKQQMATRDELQDLVRDMCALRI